MTPADLVRSFYADVWNRQDHQVAERIISPNFRFRGSLGPEKHGFPDFWTMSRRCILPLATTAA